MSAVVVADFFIRSDYYSTILCENQDKPEKSCHGKCQLAKTVKSEKENEAPLPEFNTFTFEWIISDEVVAFNNNLREFNKDGFCYCQPHYKIDFSSGYFHPPESKV